MKRVGLLLLIVLAGSVLGLSSVYLHLEGGGREDFFFGVSFGQDTVEEAKLLIDRVKGYTNFFLINNWNIVDNRSALTQVTEYAVNADLHFMVFFVVTREWHLNWLENAEEKYGDKLLGAYLYDEPGGRQIDTGTWFSTKGNISHPEYAEQYARLLDNASNYSEASELFIHSVSSYYMQDLKEQEIPLFTSDYALYWFDYRAGYDIVLAQLGWGHNTTKHIALCRGAANMESKDWGAIITWTFNEPPYLASGPEILEDMLAAYRAGSKYVAVFNYARDSETEEAYNILKEEHYQAMQDFWTYIHQNPQHHGQIKGEYAYVLPQDYGWGMRHPEDNIWGQWPPDEKAPIIWDRLTQLIPKYGLALDIIYPTPDVDYREKYSKIYSWNSTIN